MLGDIKIEGVEDPIARTKELLEAYTAEPPQFQRGDVIRFRDGMANRRIHQYVMVERLSTPVKDPATDSGDMNFNTEYDILAATLMPTRDGGHALALYHLESRRMEKVGG